MEPGGVTRDLLVDDATVPGFDPGQTSPPSPRTRDAPEKHPLRSVDRAEKPPLDAALRRRHMRPARTTLADSRCARAPRRPTPTRGASVQASCGRALRWPRCE